MGLLIGLDGMTGQIERFQDCGHLRDNAISCPRGLLSLITGGLDLSHYAVRLVTVYHGTDAPWFSRR
jgi:hypothetical protein